MKEKYWLDIGDWLLIDQKYFETILVDFMGRPDGWWHSWILYTNDQISIKIKPKQHNNHNGWSRGYDGKFKKVKWVDHFESKIDSNTLK
jgi:hypothetical protein